MSKWALGSRWPGTVLEKHLITSSNLPVSWETRVAEWKVFVHTGLVRDEERQEDKREDRGGTRPRMPDLPSGESRALADVQAPLEQSYTQVLALTATAPRTAPSSILSGRKIAPTNVHVTLGQSDSARSGTCKVLSVSCSPSYSGPQEDSP